MTTLTKVATRDRDRHHTRVPGHAAIAPPPPASPDADGEAACTPYNAVRTEEGV
ncbi:hypothetical protein [Thermomonospora amylolytica]|uniref:hypothetical protein n=1 Tax=Thermomonospora amylolytica TaxID=1411117 RepID=UPI0013006B4F|nr:hypothetical protein [Thermomonospora amylolytica]